MDGNVGWLEVLGLGAAWAGPIITVMVYLHTRRANLITDLKTDLMAEIRAIRTEMDEVKARTDIEHRAIQAQVSAMATTFRDSYVRQRDFDDVSRAQSTVIGDVRREIGAIGIHLNERIDELLKALALRGY